jgi:translation initiation factor 1 (eIF-1/SUI1)
MRIFNRIFVILLLAALFALGVFVFLASISPFLNTLGAQGTDLQNLPPSLRPDGLSAGLRDYLTNIENGSVGAVDAVVLIVVALLGLILLVLELKPPTPRRVRMQQGIYITRSAVRDEATRATEQEHEVLQSNVKVKAQRRPGAKVNVTASVREGEGTRGLQSEVRDRVQQHLGQMGIPVSNLKVRIAGSDPRETKTRVK